MKSSLAYPSITYPSFWNRLPILLLILALPIGFLGAAVAPQEYTLLVLVAPFAALTAVVIVVYPEILLIVTALMLPVERTEIFDPFLPAGLTIAKLLGTLLLGVVIFNIVSRREKFRLFDDTQDYAVTFFGATLLFSAILSVDPNQVFSEIDRIFRLMAFYFAIKTLARNPKTISLIMIGLFATSLYASAYSIYEYNTTTTIWGEPIRVGGVNENSNNFAMESVIAIAIGVYLFQASRYHLTKLFYALGIGIIVVSIFLSGSRGGAISLSVVTSLLILQHPKRVQISLVLILVIILSFPLLPSHIQSRFIGSNSDFQNKFEQGAQRSTERRTAYLNYGSKIIAERPILGTGYRTFQQLYPLSEFAKFDNPLTAHETYRVAHNIYLETATGAGMLGLFALLAMLAIGWRACYLAAKMAIPRSVVWTAAKGLQYGLIGFAVSSIFISSDQSKYLWFLLGMSSAVFYFARMGTDSRQRAISYQDSLEQASI